MTFVTWELNGGVGTPIRHPLVDEVTPQVIRIDSRARVVRLSAPLADLLTRPRMAGRTVVIVTGEQSRVTIGLRSALVAAGGLWLVATEQGFRDGITGADSSTINDAVRPRSRTEANGPRDEPRTLISSLTDSDSGTVQVSVDVTVLHRPGHGGSDHEGVLGGVVDVLAEAVGGYRPRAWGASEPLEKSWDRWAMTQDARHRSPEPSRLIVEGDRFSAAITARVSDHGIEETIALTADVPGGSAGLDDAIGRVGSALAALTETELPTFALVLAREGEPDRTFRPVAYPAPNPVVLLIGAPSVRRLDLDRSTFAPDQVVVLAGTATRPAYLLPLGDSARSGWEALHDALDSVGSARLTTLVDPPLLHAWEDDLQADLDRHGDPHPHGGPQSQGGQQPHGQSDRSREGDPHAP